MQDTKGTPYSITTTDNKTVNLKEGICVCFTGEKEVQVASISANGVSYDILPAMYILNLWIRGENVPNALVKDIRVFHGHDHRNNTDYDSDRGLVFMRDKLHVSENLDKCMMDALKAYEALYQISVEIFGIEHVYKYLLSSHITKDCIHPGKLVPYVEYSNNGEVSFAEKHAAINAINELYEKIAIISVEKSTDKLVEIGKMLGLGTEMIKDHDVQYYTRYYFDTGRRLILPVDRKVLWDKEYSAEAVERMIKRVKAC